MAKTYKNTDARREYYITTWRKMAETASFGGMTLAQFIAATETATTVRENLAAVTAERAGLLRERNIAEVELRKVLRLVINGVRSDPEYGEDSPLYRGLGYTPVSERKRPALKPAPVSIPATAPASVA